MAQFDDWNTLAHHGIKGQKWGVRRFQNPDGTLTEAGKKHEQKQFYKQFKKAYRNSASGVIYDDEVLKRLIPEKVARRSEEFSGRYEKARTEFNDYASKIHDKYWKNGKLIGFANKKERAEYDRLSKAYNDSIIEADDNAIHDAKRLLGKYANRQVRVKGGRRSYAHDALTSIIAEYGDRRFYKNKKWQGVVG